MVLIAKPGSRLVLLALIGAVAVTTGCGRFSRKTASERTLPYASAVKDQKDGTLVVTVKAGGASLDAVRESARYPVTSHCLTRRGSSDADWTIDPATGDWAYSLDDKGTMTLGARCRS